MKDEITINGTVYVPKTVGQAIRPMTIEELAVEMRANIKGQAVRVKDMMRDLWPNKEGADIGESKANIMLAYRHLEDASMRLGKVIQAQDGGKSVYDK